MLPIYTDNPIKVSRYANVKDKTTGRVWNYCTIRENCYEWNGVDLFDSFKDVATSKTNLKPNDIDLTNATKLNGCYQ